MAPPRLHLDADTSMKALHLALVARGHDVTRTPTAWMARDASDTAQLLGATAQGRILFTFNTHDFPVLAQQYPQHGGLVLAAQQSWSVSQLIAALDALLTETEGRRLAGAGALAESVAPGTNVRAAESHDMPLRPSEPDGLA